MTEDELDKTIFRKQAELMIRNIANYPFNLFKVETKHLISTMIKADLTEFVYFIDKMAKSPSFV